MDKVSDEGKARRWVAGWAERPRRDVGGQRNLHYQGVRSKVQNFLTIALRKRDHRIHCRERASLEAAPRQGVEPLKSTHRSMV